MDTKPLILIAEDDSSNYRYLEVILRKQYELLWAKNGQEAVELALNNEPLLVLMDNKMPVMNGLEAMIEIKKAKPQLPVVMQTAFAFDNDREQAMQAGADGYLTKPILSKLLRDTVEQYVK